MCEQGDLTLTNNFALCSTQVTNNVAAEETISPSLCYTVEIDGRDRAYLMRFWRSWSDKLFRNRRGQSKSISVTCESARTAPPWNNRLRPRFNKVHKLKMYAPSIVDVHHRHRAKGVVEWGWVSKDNWAVILDCLERSCVHLVRNWQPGRQGC